MLNKLNSLINIRNFLNLAVNDFSFNMTNEQHSKVNKKISALNKAILEMAIELDVEQETRISTTQINSTMEVRNVDDLDKLASLAKGMANVKQPKKVRVVDEAAK